MISYACPYFIDSKFSLIIHSFSDQHQSISIIYLKILEIYIFTKNQIMKVIITSELNDCNLSTFAFLKLFDCHYIEKRMNDDDNELSWNYKREFLITQITNEIMKYRKEISKSIIHKFILENMNRINYNKIILLNNDLNEIKLETIKNLNEKIMK